jgi:hypothetical protein
MLWCEEDQNGIAKRNKGFWKKKCLKILRTRENLTFYGVMVSPTLLLDWGWSAQHFSERWSGQEDPDEVLK